MVLQVRCPQQILCVNEGVSLIIVNTFSNVYMMISVTVYAVSAVAQQVLWNCLIEDPALVLRHFLEKLTVSNRQVRRDFKYL